MMQWFFFIRTTQLRKSLCLTLRYKYLCVRNFGIFDRFFGLNQRSGTYTIKKLMVFRSIDINQCTFKTSARVFLCYFPNAFKTNCFNDKFRKCSREKRIALKKYSTIIDK